MSSVTLQRLKDPCMMHVPMQDTNCFACTDDVERYDRSIAKGGDRVHMELLKTQARIV